MNAAQELRLKIRSGQFVGPTAGQAPGFVQTNVVILPAVYADDFEAFCRANPRPCPLIERGEVGSWQLRSAPDGDIRTDVPRYRVFRHGIAEADQPTDIRHLWRDDMVAFLIGCSFTFEQALLQAGLPVRHIEEGRNVPMYRTNVPCQSAGPFAGPLVVSMRPLAPEQVPVAVEVSGRFTAMHGAPVHSGDPAAIGIADINRPDYGDAVTIKPGEVPVFWACGVTPQLALEAARCELAITHSPGCMFVTDLPSE